MQKTLLLVSGPAAVGKRPLVDALRKRISGTQEVMIIASSDQVKEEGRVWRAVRQMRTDQVRALPPDRYVIGSVRGAFNAIDLQHVEEAFGCAELTVLVPFYKLVPALTEHSRIRALCEKGVRVIRVFISPFSSQEIRVCDDQREVLPMIMAGRDVERTLAEKSVMQFGRGSLPNVYAAHHRATTLVDELESSAQFDHVLVLRNGHRPETWASDPPVGDAGKALEELVSIVNKGESVTTP